MRRPASGHGPPRSPPCYTPQVSQLVSRARLALVLLALATLAWASPAAAERPPPAAPDPAAVSIDAAAAVLFAGEVPAACAGLQAAATAPQEVTRAVVECMLSERFRKDRRARQSALALYRRTGAVAGVGPQEVMDGGYRGKITLVPQLPTGGHRRHLEHVALALDDLARVLGQLQESARSPLAFRWQHLTLRFVRSVGKRTPSAYAADWTVTYNVNGSLLGSAAGVRETLVHELFHLNDQALGDWSARTLSKDYDAIVARCLPKLERACLAPYAPGATTVRGGTYYAFQPDNGSSVHEYAAELALRYFREQRELLTAGKLAAAPFKCGPAENGRAWRALVDTFFAGVDRTPACK